ncbi:MAG TPA: DUF6588 family protein [Saprospiraceae bacterium]|nr:DUF6588 family protein [Saprospiraceae bacterium]
MKRIHKIIAGLMLITTMVHGQDQNIKDYLDAYLGENAVPYVQPLADLFASNVNTGIWEWSRADSNFYFRLKAQAIVSYPAESMRTFIGHTSGDFMPAQTVTAPTIIGDRANIILQGEDTTFYVFPGGYDLNRLTLGTPQLTIGGFLHSELSGRFLSFSLGKDLGKVNVLGLGARHFLTGYFKEAPIDISVGYFYHHIEAGDYLDSDQHLVSVHAGKSGKFFSGQLMLGYQTSGSAIHYTYEDGDETYDVDLFMKNQNNLIMEASAGLKLGPLFICSAVSYSQHLSVSGGFGLTF